LSNLQGEAIQYERNGNTIVPLNISRGLYFLSFEIQGEIYTYKILKQWEKLTIGKIFRLVYLFYFHLLSFISYSQYECVTADSVEIEPKTQLFCNDPNNKLDNYLLDRLGINKYDQSPKYTVNLKVHIMQYSLSDPRNLSES